ncbi:hypothetical protein [Microbacterium deminutum]|uniref:Uncharacterized protein n=1 Tax=Microbacterium deminutum TaxID=344164 RepID=A0ABN2R4S4_9MICO
MTIAAGNLVRDLTVLADRIAPDAVMERALDTLLPGESIEVRVSGVGGAAPALIADSAILRSANDLLARD